MLIQEEQLDFDEILKSVAKRTITSVLKKTKGNRVATAELLNIDRCRLYRLMKILNINIPTEYYRKDKL